MNKEEEWVQEAIYAIGKNMDYEQLYYSDNMYGKESETDEVWNYVLEHDEIGRTAFNEKYRAYLSSTSLTQQSS